MTRRLLPSTRTEGRRKRGNNAGAARSRKLRGAADFPSDDPASYTALSPSPVRAPVFTTFLAERLRWLREKNGLSVHEASARVRVGPFLWRLIEENKYSPSDIFTEAVAAAFDCNLGWLETGFEER